MTPYQPAPLHLAAQHTSRVQHGLHSVVLPRQAVLDLLAQPGAQDLRLHMGQDEHGAATVFALATAEDGSNIKALAVQAIMPCPPLCGPDTVSVI